MKIFVISYDLINHKDYEKIHNAIKSYHNWAKPLESLWLIKTNDSAAYLRDYLKKSLDSDDKLVVFQADGDWATRNISKNVSKWIKNNI